MTDDDFQTINDQLWFTTTSLRILDGLREDYWAHRIRQDYEFLATEQKDEALDQMFRVLLNKFDGWQYTIDVLFESATEKHCHEIRQLIRPDTNSQEETLDEQNAIFLIILIKRGSNTDQDLLTHHLVNSKIDNYWCWVVRNLSTDYFELYCEMVASYFKEIHPKPPSFDIVDSVKHTPNSVKGIIAYLQSMPDVERAFRNAIT